MRVTSFPPACVLAAAAVSLAAALVPAAALAERWRRPVPGEVARAFSYSPATPFRAGSHRGADLAAAPGTAVRAACGGRVVFAGAVAGAAPVVTIRCGIRRVTYLPLSALRVRRGDRVRPGSLLATVAPGHRGLHVGVRRAASRFAYEDPLPFLARPSAGRPLVGAPRGGARPAPAPPLRAAEPRRPAPARAPAPAAAPRRVAPAPAAARPVSAPPAPAAAPRRVAPAPEAAGPARWPVWVGLAAVLLGAAGSGTVALRRRRAERGATVEGQAVAA